MKKKFTFTFNTEKAELLDTVHHGEYGDAEGYEVRLYCSPQGILFIYGIGGPDSCFPDEVIRHFNHYRDGILFEEFFSQKLSDMEISEFPYLDKLFDGCSL
jgi:hypothetical protein